MGFDAKQVSGITLEKVLFPLTYQLGAWFPNEDATAYPGFGMLALPLWTDSGQTQGRDFDGVFMTQETANAGGSSGGVGYIPRPCTRDVNTRFQLKFKLPAITNIRVYVALGELGVSIYESDEPAAEFVGIRFSTNASDTVFQFMVGDGTGGASGVTKVASSVTVVVGTAYILDVDLKSSGDLLVRILDKDGVELDSNTFTGADKVPVSSTPIPPLTHMGNFSAGKAKFTHYGFTALNRP